MTTQANRLGTDVVTQVAIVVHDIEAAARRWADLLGCEVPHAIVTDGYDDAHTQYRGHASHATAKLAFLHVGQVDIELIQPDSEPSIWREHLDKHGESVQHIAFHVPDMAKTLDNLGQKGMEAVQTGDFTGGCYAYVDTIPALGVMLELLASKP